MALNPFGERIFYVVAIATLGIVVVTGFARTFYLRPLFHRTALAPALYLHGAVMTAWFALIALQYGLIASKRGALHRQVGRVGPGVGVLVLAVGAITVVRAAARLAPPWGLPFWELVVAFDGLNLLLFSVFVISAIALRKRRDVHARLMILASVALLPPAIGRASLLFMHGGNELAVLFSLTAVLVLILAADVAQLRRAHPALLYGGGAIIVANFATYVAQTAA